MPNAGIRLFEEVSGANQFTGFGSWHPYFGWIRLQSQVACMRGRKRQSNRGVSKVATATSAMFVVTSRTSSTPLTSCRNDNYLSCTVPAPSRTSSIPLFLFTIPIPLAGPLILSFSPTLHATRSRGTVVG